MDVIIIILKKILLLINYYMLEKITNRKLAKEAQTLFTYGEESKK